MTKRPETQETLILALELMRRIPRKRKVTASELHQQLQSAGFERDLRTIQRQLEMLTQHFDIERDDSSKPYGYRWREHAVGLSLPMLTEQESVMLLLAQQHLANLLPANLMKSMKGFFDQAHANLYAAQNNSAQLSRQLSREWLEKVRVVSTNQPLLPPTIASGVLENISNALFANHWLNIEYQSAAAKRQKARVMPLGLAQQGPRLYLVCRFEGYDKERSLAMHRFISASNTGFHFQRPQGFNLQAYDDEGHFGISQGHWVRLQFNITKGSGIHLLELPLSKDQQVKEAESHYRITATVVETDLLHRWLRGYGQEVTEISLHPLPTPTAKDATA